MQEFSSKLYTPFLSQYYKAKAFPWEVYFIILLQTKKTINMKTTEIDMVLTRYFVFTNEIFNIGQNFTHGLKIKVVIYKHRVF